MKTFIKLVFIIMVSLQAHPTVESAAKGWPVPAVPEIISESILYYPIMHDSVKNIPIKDSEEELVDLFVINNPRIKPMSLFDVKFASSYEGYSKVRLGVYRRLLKMLEVLPEEVGIVYSEGFRSLHMQKKYFDNTLKQTLLKMKDKQAAYKEASKYVSPFIDNVPTHATGAAIDMTLFKIQDGHAQLLDMGSFDVVDSQNETFSENTTPEQRTNRLLLLNAAVQAGLANYGYEWWHYSYGDKMWAFVKKHPNAIYGLAIDKNDPILHIDKETYLKEF